jgi:hypothetical protein
MSRTNIEISEKVQKSLITPIMSRLQRLKYIEIKEKSVESFFKISVIREREAVFQSSHISGQIWRHFRPALLAMKMGAHSSPLAADRPRPHLYC